MFHFPFDETNVDYRKMSIIARLTDFLYSKATSRGPKDGRDTTIANRYYFMSKMNLVNAAELRFSERHLINY